MSIDAGISNGSVSLRVAVTTIFCSVVAVAVALPIGADAGSCVCAAAASGIASDSPIAVPSAVRLMLQRDRSRCSTIPLMGKLRTWAMVSQGPQRPQS
ncbi:MAG: hypothetical protein ACREO8_10050 [Luteimonas sp.]